MAPHLRHEQGTLNILQLCDAHLIFANFRYTSTMTYVSRKRTSLNVCNCFHLGRRGAGSGSDASV